MTFMEQSAKYGFENNEGRGVKTLRLFLWQKEKRIMSKKRLLAMVSDLKMIKRTHRFRE